MTIKERVQGWLFVMRRSLQAEHIESIHWIVDPAQVEDGVDEWLGEKC